MKLNGNLNFHTLGAELRNAIVEKLGSDPATTVTGRFYYNTTDNEYRFYNGTTWQPFGEGALAAAINASLGSLTDANGDFDVGTVNGALANVTGATDIFGVLDQLDDAIAAGAETYRIKDSDSDTVVRTAATGGGDEDVVEVIVPGSATPAASFSAAEVDISSQGTVDINATTTASVDGTAVTVTSSTGNTTIAATLGNIVLDGVVTQVQDNAELRLMDADNTNHIGLKSATAVTTDVTYTLPEAPASSGYVLASTTGGVMSWIDPAGTGATIALNDLTDATITTVGNDEVLQYTGAGWENQTLSEAGIQPADADLTTIAGLSHTGGEVLYSNGGTWATAAPGATSGVQPYDATILVDADIGVNVQAYDAALDALSAVSGTGFVVQTAADTFITTTLAASAVAGDQGISLTDASGVGDAPTIGLDVVGLTAEAGTPSGTDTLPMYDGTNNVKVSITQLSAAVGAAGGINLNDIGDVDDLAAHTADAPVIFMGDGTNFDTVSLVAGTDISGVAVSTTSFTLNVDDAFLRNTGDNLTAGTLTVDSGAAIAVATGGTLSIADAPTLSTHATNKAYVDGLVGGLTWKNSVVAGTTVNVTLAGSAPNTVDGISLAADDRVLVLNQTALAENGIYVVTTLGAGADGTWTRATDMDSLTPIDEVNGAGVWVEAGSTYGDQGYTVTSQVATLGTDPVTWTQFNGATGITDGIGLLKSGNVLDVRLGPGIGQNSDFVAVDLYDDANGAIIHTTDGTSREGTNNSAGIHLLLDAAGAMEQTSAGLRVGAGLVTNAMLANSSFTVQESGAANPQGIDLGGTLTVTTTAGTGVAVDTATADTITIAGVDATTTTKGVASFDTNHFTVSSGAVSANLATTTTEGVASFAAADFAVDGAGEVTLASTVNILRMEDADTDTFISVDTTPTDSDTITIQAGGNSGSTAGSVNINSGTGVAANDYGGNINLTGGNHGGGASTYGGNINLTGGDGTNGGVVTITSGRGTVDEPGAVVISGNGGDATYQSGTVTISGGSGNPGAASGGHLILNGGFQTGGGSGGKIRLSAGLTASDQGGDIEIFPGSGLPGVLDGVVKILGPNSARAPELRIYENNALLGGHIGFTVADVGVTSDTVYQLPEAPGTTGFLLSSTTGGVMSWVDPTTVGSTRLEDLNDVTAATSGGSEDAAGSVLVKSAAGATNYAADQIQYNYDSSITTGAATSHTITHNLGQQYVSVTVYDQTGPAQIIPQSVTLTDANTVTITFNSAIQCYAVIMGVPGVGLSG